MQHHVINKFICYLVRNDIFTLHILKRKYICIGIYVFKIISKGYFSINFLIINRYAGPDLDPSCLKF